MKWFDGKIPDAIQVAKQTKSLFIVYVYGEDELSQQMDLTWENPEVSSYIAECRAVPIRILRTSEECKFFSQIYPVVIIPSTYCIGDGGVPLEVVGGHIPPDKFVQKLNNANQALAAQPVTSSSQMAPSAVQPVTLSSPMAPSAAQPVTLSSPMASSAAQQGQTTTHEAAAGSSVTGTTGDHVSPLPLEVKVERAKELLEKKKMEKAQVEIEKAKEEEIKRRKLGQDVNKLKLTQKDMQLKELQDQMKKDRDEEKKAREKVRQQIAKDREDRNVRFLKDKEEQTNVVEEKKRERLLEQQKVAAAEEVKKSLTTRIQLRLPDGSSISNTFQSSDTLQVVYSYVTEKLGKHVTLSTTFPKCQFSDEHMSQTMVDLHLTPSAVLIVLPAGQVRQQFEVNQFNNVFAFVMAPFIFLWNFVYSLFSSGGNNPQTDSNVPANRSTGRTQSYTRQEKDTIRGTTAYQRLSSSRQDGNVRRLQDMQDDDDDDMSTYNGNSTEQL